MVAHRLDALLKPKSMAIVGASQTADSLGLFTTQQAVISGFTGPVWAVNPKYREVAGLPCFGSIADLPAVPEHVVLAVPNARIEEEVKRAIDAGVRSATIFASCYLPEDTHGNSLTDRLRDLCTSSGLLLCGGNCLGFFNLQDKVRSSWFPHPELAAGSISLIVHSGSVFVTMSGLDRRLRFNCLVSSGQELSVTAADYLDFMLAQPTTRTVGLFLETVRDPQAFVAALQKAKDRRIPLVVLKVGRTDKSAELARSHSGALAGNDAAYEALFDQYGVIRVKNLDEFAATLQMVSHPKALGRGRGIVGLHDSGGQRGMAIDLAADIGVPYAEISAETRRVLADNLDFGLAPVNPLDVWGTGNNFEQIYTNCFRALLDDPDTALGILFSDIGNGGVLDQPWAESTLRVAETTDLPVFIAQNFSRSPNPSWLAEISHRGVPVLDGTENALTAAKHWLDYRAFLSRREKPASHDVPQDTVIARWRSRLGAGRVLDEAESLQLFRDFGVAVPRFFIAENAAEVAAGMAARSFPVAVKTAEDGILHKSDVGGVHLNIGDLTALQAAYSDIASRLGKRVLVAEMAPVGPEVALGMIADEQFGPLLLVACGGVLVELLKDRQIAMPPLGPERAHQLLQRLKGYPLLAGYRGRAAADLPSLTRLIARFSILVATLGDLISEIDINPVIAGANGAIAVDGIVIPKSTRAASAR
jgi:acetate---CoA ligase (ADP-forming)